MAAPAFRAITTRYKGYNFRSRLEARWAVFFDHLKIRWDYEPEGFELGNGLRYLPDFWLPDFEMWVEIKPGPCDQAAKEKAWRLVEHSGYCLFMSNGMPDSFGSLLCALDVGGEGNNFTRYCFNATVSWRKGGILLQDEYANELEDMEPDRMGFSVSQKGLRARIAVAPRGSKRAAIATNCTTALEAARGARFEFGEKGGVL